MSLVVMTWKIWIGEGSRPEIIDTAFDDPEFVAETYVEKNCDPSEWTRGGLVVVEGPDGVRHRITVTSSAEWVFEGREIDEGS